ncbi:Leucyl-tRNA synthetase [hydrothermal vent metagenome]|uniref:leucine--tRNA ligase n=1 Tax=hydrothermal vent metagenome TaxID=652676 RepID=A0A1W1CRX7_9ZZZZ
MKEYNHRQIEQDTQKYWHDNDIFKVVEDNNKEKFYCLSMFPYPSGRLHMGHVRNYTLGDVISRYQRMLGKNVLQPIGWDAFGLPAENAALKNKVPPAKWTYENIAYMRNQLKKMGLSYDWSREIATCHPEYYRWEQWLFIKLFKKGLVYKKNSIVNWDPVDQTVLANEQVIDGKGWRSGAIVEKKEISQWFIKITDYAEELLKDLETLEGWPEQVKTMQKNWIGKSKGLEITFKNKHQDLTVFTTRPDTLMGVTYVAIAAEHPLATLAVEKATDSKIKNFIAKCKTIQTNEANMETMEKEGVNSGLVCFHPITGEEIPIWIANFVLMSYGTGAVMSVPAHDERDYDFAKKYKLPIKQVIVGNLKDGAITTKDILCNSGEFNGLDFEQSFEAIKNKLKNLGNEKINYRLRDWGISRQRYWGCPIPIINCHKCGEVAEKITNLPVKLPENVKFDGVSSPIKKMPDFYETKCPKCGGEAKRETDTFDTFFESSWYFARYACSDNKTAMLDERANYWLGVDQYVGGIEHAILHLLYARFFNKLLRDEGLIKNDEPFNRLLTQGMVLKDGAKMSKSKGNTVDPEQMIEKYGADTVRLFILFAAPATQDLEWSDQGLEGANRFVKKVYRLTSQFLTAKIDNTTENKELQTKLKQHSHLALEKFKNDINNRQSFNTAIATMMELCNTISKFNDKSEQGLAVLKESLEIIILCLSPITPHLSHQLWFDLGHKSDIAFQDLPKVDKSALVQDEITIIVQVMGKLRAKIQVANNIAENDAISLAKNNENVIKFIEGKTIVKTIFVPNKLINFVIK